MKNEGGGGGGGVILLIIYSNLLNLLREFQYE